MTDAPTCRPPPEFQRERWHWLLSPEEPPELVLDEWEEGAWVVDVIATPEAMAMYGFTYSRPCRPDDATVRARLEKENARLREALGKLVDEFGCSIDLYHRNGPDYTFKDGTQVFGVAVLLDREELITSAKAILDGVTGEGE